jgi:hypothetical protein
MTSGARKGYAPMVLVGGSLLTRCAARHHPVIETRKRMLTYSLIEIYEWQGSFKPALRVESEHIQKVDRCPSRFQSFCILVPEGGDIKFVTPPA